MSDIEPNVQRRAAERASTLLESLGWQRLSASDALALRKGRRDEPMLSTLLEERLAALNSFEHQGQRRPPGNASIAVAIQALQHGLQEELGHANEQIWSALKIGIPVRERVDGNTQSLTLRFVDWHNPANNRYHFVERFPVAGPSVTCTPDLALFVNGIPFVVIELKSPRTGDNRRQPLEEAISQLQRYQRAQDIPQLFHYAQLLLAVSAQAAAYGVVGASREHWMEWRETAEETASLRDLIEGTKDRSSGIEAPSILNEQDRLLHALCRPARLLDLIHWFTLFQNGRRIVARPHQVTAIQAVLREVTTRQTDGTRRGGVVWHAQGSGKSLTMVMLARVLLDALPGRKTRVLFVSDRGELDVQIYDNLLTAGIDCRRAATGRELVHLLGDPQVRAVTTVIQKFGSAANSDVLIADSPDIFVLVDEAHRAQSAALASAMRSMLPRACFIGFTGTPVSRTLDVFGPLLSTYTFREAIADNTLVPLVLQQYVADTWPDDQLGMQRLDDPPGFEEDFSELRINKSTLFESSARIQTVAESIANHFTEHFSGTPLKGLVVAFSRDSAVRFKHCLDKIGTVSSEVIISFEDPLYSAGSPQLHDFRRHLIQKFGSEARYEADVLKRFLESEHPQLLIVVDKLLTGLDAPRVGVLYIDRPMRGHRLLQAMARVNRSYQGKNYGLIVDYVGLNHEFKQLALVYGSDLGIAFDELKQPIWEPKPVSTETPRRIKKSPAALELACEKILRQELEPFPWSIDADAVEKAAAQISDAILSRRKVDWTTDIDAQNQMMTAIEDVLFDLRAEQGVPLPIKSIDSIMVACVAVAREIAA